MIITLSNGMQILIDDQDAALATFHWSASVHRKNGKTRVYAVREVAGRRFYLHREIMGNPAGDVDHVNAEDTLDCRRSNLRAASRSQNNANSRKRDHATSRYKGVHFHRDTGKWACQLKKKHYGLFREECDAALAYNLVAEELYGDFARLNAAV